MGEGQENSTIEPGSGRFLFRDTADATGKSLTVWYRCPPGAGPDTPIVFALHGFDRAGEYFRDCWAAHADREGFLVVVPEFDNGSFPGGGAYNYGNVIADKIDNGEEGGVNPRALWSYPVLDRVFETVRDRCGSNRDRFSLFGHSAGGQFAHRYLALTGAPSVDIAVPTNCGWYMAPDAAMPFPAGVGGLEIENETLIRYFERPVVLLLGDADTDENDSGLSRAPEAMAQGPHRFARGQHYFALCRDKAAALGAAFNWRLEIAPGVGHDDAQVAAPAARIIADYLAGRG